MLFFSYNFLCDSDITSDLSEKVGSFYIGLIVVSRSATNDYHSFNSVSIQGELLTNLLGPFSGHFIDV